MKYTSEERCNIGKYASEMGTAAAVRKFWKERPNLNEITVQTFVKKYKDELTLDAQGESSKKNNGNFERWTSFASRKSRRDGTKLPIGYATSWGLAF